MTQKRLVALQDESSKTDNTSEAGSGELASTGGGLGDRLLGGSDATGGRGDNGSLSRGRNDGSLLGAVVADLVGLGHDGLLDGARAVGDGDDTGLGDGDGLVTVGDLSGLGAVGGVALDDLSDDDGTVLAVGVRARDGGNEGSSDRELHLDGIRVLGLVLFNEWI